MAPRPSRRTASTVVDRQVLVAQEFLDGPYARPAVQQVRGETVPQGMGRDALEPRQPSGVVGHALLHRARCDASPPPTLEDRTAGVAGGQVAVQQGQVEVRIEGTLQVLAQPPRRDPEQGQDTFLVSLAQHAHAFRREVQVRQVETDHLGQAQTQAVERFQDGAVATPAGFRGVGHLQKGLDQLLAQVARESTPAAGGGSPGQRLRHSRKHARQLEIAREGADRRDLPRDGGLGASPAAQKGQVIAHGVARREEIAPGVVPGVVGQMP